MIVDAPAMRAPCTAESPIGPQPTTATLEAGSIAVNAWVAVAPSPATLVQPQTMPTSAAGLVVKIGTTHSSNGTMTSARPPMCEF